MPEGGDGVAPEPVEVPVAALSAEALEGVIEAFIMREGTDYGEHEYSLAEKVAQVREQVLRGDARILFDPVTASTTLLPRGQSGGN